MQSDFYKMYELRRSDETFFQWDHGSTFQKDEDEHVLINKKDPWVYHPKSLYIFSLLTLIHVY